MSSTVGILFPPVGRVVLVVVEEGVEEGVEEVTSVGPVVVTVVTSEVYTSAVVEERLGASVDCSSVEVESCPRRLGGS